MNPIDHLQSEIEEVSKRIRRRTRNTILALVGVLAIMGGLVKLRHNTARLLTVPPAPATNAPSGLRVVSSYTAPDVSVEGRKPFEKLHEPVDPVNNGWVIDLDGDGIQDFVILRGHVLSWAKGRKDGTRDPEIVVANIKPEVHAYKFMVLPGDSWPSIVFYTVPNDDGYFQKCLGIQEGVPYFGDMEAVQ